MTHGASARPNFDATWKMLIPQGGAAAHQRSAACCHVVCVHRPPTLHSAQRALREKKLEAIATVDVGGSRVVSGKKRKRLVGTHTQTNKGGRPAAGRPAIGIGMDSSLTEQSESRRRL
jgi:hypothetical protein